MPLGPLNLKRQVTYDLFRRMDYVGYSGSFATINEFLLPIGKTVTDVFTGTLATPLQVSGSLAVSGNIRQNGKNLYLNYAGTDANQFLYFYDGSSPTGQYLEWDNTNTQFVLSGKTVVAGDLQSTARLFIGVNGPDANRSLFFYEGTAAGASLTWDHTNAEFVFSHDLASRTHKLKFGISDDMYLGYNQSGDPTGVLTSTKGIYISGTGNSLVGGNIYLAYQPGASPTEKNSSVNFWDGASATGQNLQWTDAKSRFDLSGPLKTNAISGNGAGALVANGSAQISGSLALTGGIKIGNAYSLPRVDGTNTYVLSTNGAGVVSWAAPVSGAETGVYTGFKQISGSLASTGKVIAQGLSVPSVVPLYSNSRLVDFTWNSTDDYLKNNTWSTSVHKVHYVYPEIVKGTTKVTVNFYVSMNLT